MFKRFILAFAGLLACSIANASGTVPGFSLTPQFDLTGKVMPGCKLAVIQAGTTSTPQTAYQDSALTIPSPGGSNLTCDASGRLAQFFLADGLIKLRLTNSTGTQVFVGDNLLVVGPSGGGGGGGGTVDPTTILSTGDFKLNYGTGILSGFVRANGRTIGSATSGATERANSDCQALFQYLWGADPNLIVSGGRGVSAAADWAANKAIAVPDWRDRALAGLGDMGNSDAGLLTSASGCTTPTVLGAACGTETQTLTLTQLPTGITVAGTVTVNPSIAPSGLVPVENNGIFNGVFQSPTAGTSGSYVPATNSGGWGGTNSFTGSNTLTSNNTSGTAHPIVSPLKQLTIFVKL